MQSHASKAIVPGGFVESGTIVHEGREYTAGGAYVWGDHALVYVNPYDPGLNRSAGTVTSWEGSEMGVYRVTGAWRQFSYHLGQFTMLAIRVILVDGTRWHGRFNSDWSRACKLRRCK